MTAAKVLSADNAAVCSACGAETTDLRDTDDGQRCPDCAPIHCRLINWRLA